MTSDVSFPLIPANQSPRLNIGWIRYWNLHPFRRELLRLTVDGVTLEEGTPAMVNSRLISGQINLAPASSICLASSPELEMALPMGVVSDGPVMSVYLGFYREHEELLEKLIERRQMLRDIAQHARALFREDARSIARHITQEAKKLPRLPLSLIPGLRITPESASSAILAKILYKLWFGEHNYQLMVERNVSENVYTRAPAELLIGDQALCRKTKFYKILDLGSLWKEMTGLPFVYAVWQSRGGCLNGWRRKILNVGQVAENRMQVEPAVYMPEICPVDDAGCRIPLAEYWKCIYYEIGPRELRGLLVFLCLARALGLVPGDKILAKIVRWQDLSLRDSIPLL
ncbi:MAG: hypothetical protein H6618_04385 [Deltaproteobacteria bacterium]|nr:hypothetical protein [Deltaproteobacteria bacterium]